MSGHIEKKDQRLQTKQIIFFDPAIYVSSSGIWLGIFIFLSGSRQLCISFQRHLPEKTLAEKILIDYLCLFSLLIVCCFCHTHTQSRASLFIILFGTLTIQLLIRGKRTSSIFWPIGWPHGVFTCVYHNSHYVTLATESCFLQPLDCFKHKGQMITKL